MKNFLTLFLFLFLASLAEAQTLLDEDLFNDGGFNPTPGTYLIESYIVSADYTAAGTNAFETPAAAGIVAPTGNPTYIGRVQWGISGSDERQNFTVYGIAAESLQEFYFEIDMYYPTGFKWCAGKPFRAGRQESEAWVGDYISIEGGAGLVDPAPYDEVPSIYFGDFPSTGSPDQNEQGAFANWGNRDEWFTYSVWAKWNTYSGETANADGFLRFYINGVEIEAAKQLNKIWSTVSSHAAGFTVISAPLNMSYGSCTGGADTTSNVWVANARLYDSHPATGVAPMTGGVSPWFM